MPDPQAECGIGVKYILRSTGIGIPTQPYRAEPARPEARSVYLAFSNPYS